MHAKLRQKEIEKSRNNLKQKKELETSLENPLEEESLCEASVESRDSDSDSDEFNDNQKKAEGGDHAAKMSEVRAEFERR